MENDEDSTDWIGTNAPLMEKFEENLRCPVCREILTMAPTITECGHTFCGECISRHLNSEKTCPLCRAQIQRAKLRKNKIIEDLADIYAHGLRAELLAVAERRPEEDTQGPASPGSSTQAGAAPLSDSAREAVSDSEPPELEIPDGYGQCPICTRVMRIEKIEGNHIDQCLVLQSQQTSSHPSSPPNSRPQSAALHSSTITTSSSGSGSNGAGIVAGKAPPRKKRAIFELSGAEEVSRRKLALPLFHTMNDTKLRSTMNDMGLSTKGNRQRLVLRLQEWITLWNSNTENKHPLSTVELRRKLAAWEKVQDRTADGPPSLKQLDAESWLSQNSDNFTDLIARARKSVPKQAPPGDEPPVEQ